MAGYDEAARALDALHKEVYRIMGEADGLSDHPLLTETERDLIERAFRALEEASNQIYDRLEEARR